MLFESRRRRQRREAAERPFPDEWRTALARRWPLWRLLDDDERARLESMTQSFVAEKRWEAAQSFALTDEMRMFIAAQACLLVLELDGGIEHYGKVSTIIVHPSAVVLRGPRATGSGGLMSNDPHAIDGQARYEGPLILAWDAVSSDARHPLRGRNVVLHEFAHKLDMLDGMVDGTPPLLDGPERARWIEVCTREFRALSVGAGGTLLRDYGAQDPGEFFAVATEVLFTKPAEMREQKPDLYEVLCAFYRQDPAARIPVRVE